MSDREFENYLTLLAGLLRLDRRQRRQIAAELRAHLEDRLDELIAQGVPHDEAVQRALAEFGDAAGLAASFASISRGKNRRWLMRVTTFSIAATILIAAGVFTFWPGRNAAPGVAAVVAQAPPGEPVAAPADPFLTKVEAAAAPRALNKTRAALEAELNKPTNLDFQESSLQEVVSYLRDAHNNIPIIISTKKLDEAGVSIDQPVTKSLQGIRLSTALDLILEELELTYFIQGEVLVITTPEDARSRLEVRVYDCRDLLTGRPNPGVSNRPAQTYEGYGGAPGAGSNGDLGTVGEGTMPGASGGFGSRKRDSSAEQLMNIMTTNVAPPSWSEQGGPGSISEYNGLLVITQTAHVHGQVERVLDMLREAAGLPGPGKVVR